MANNDPPPDDLPQTPIARRKRAFAIAENPNLGNLSEYFVLANQRSVVGPSRRTGLSDTTKRILDDGIKVVEKIKTTGVDVPLSREEALAYESVVLVYDRPALLVQNDKCAPAQEPWKDPLIASDNAISARVPSVGRIEIAIGDTVREIATGFVVGDGLIMTNRHVVEAIAIPDPTDSTKWQIRSNLRPRINFKVEYLVDDSAHIFQLTSDPIYTHPKFDLGLLHVAKQSTGTPSNLLPKALMLAGTAPNLTPNKNIYIVGYPAADNENKIPKEVLDDIFGGIFEVKRLAPGEVATDFQGQGLFAHDCSTLGGNSGSFVIDLDTQLVVGLHYRGSYTKANYAVWLWALQDDLRVKGVQFD